MHDWNRKPKPEQYTPHEAETYIRLYAKGNAPGLSDFQRSPQRLWLNGDAIIPENMHFVYDSVFGGRVRINSNKIVSFTNCHFLSRAFLSGVVLDADSKIVFQDCFFYDGLDISNFAVSEFKLIRPRINKTISVKGSQITKFSIIGDPEELSEIDTLKLELSYAYESLLVSNSIIQNLEVKGFFGEKSEFNAENIQFVNLKLSDFINYGKLKISSFRDFDINLPPGDFIITDSNLGKATFFNLNLARFKRVIFLRNLLTDSTWISVKWPAMLNRLNDLDDLVSMRDTYRQLKHVYAKQGDMITEHHFHRHEMIVYMEGLYRNTYPLQVSNIKPRLWKWWKNFANLTLRFQTLFILFFSWAGSNFGLSWVRPIIFLLMANSIIIAIGASYGLFDQISFSWSNLFSPGTALQTLPDVIFYSNPLRKFDEKTFAGWFILVDLALRTVSSYCIYNIVRATRRFVK